MPENNNEMSLREALMGSLDNPGSLENPGNMGGSEGSENSAPTGAPEADMSAESSAAETAAVPASDGEGVVPSVAGAAPSAPVNPAAVPSTGVPSQAEMWGAFRQVMAENQQLKSALQKSAAQSEQQNAALQQQSQAAEGAMMRQFTPEAAVPKVAETVDSAPPMLNMQELSYLSPEEQNARLAQWQQETMAHAIRSAAAQIKDEVSREMAPMREDFEQKQQIAANAAAKANLFSLPQFADMKEREGDMERIIARTPILQGATPEMRYMLAALIDRGLHASKQPTTEDLINMASANPDVMKALEARRVAQIQKNNEALPKVVPSSGFGNANAVPESKPKNMEDVAKAFYKLY